MAIGFVFKVDGELFLTKYLGNGEFTDGLPVTNPEPYKELGENQLAISEMREVQRGNGDLAFIIKDHYFVTVSNDEKDGVRGCDILLDLEARDTLSEALEKIADELGVDI